MHKMRFGASREIGCIDLLLLQQPADLLCLLLGPKCPVVLNLEQKCMITVPQPPSWHKIGKQGLFVAWLRIIIFCFSSLMIQFILNNCLLHLQKLVTRILLQDLLYSLNVVLVLSHCYLSSMSQLAGGAEA